MGGQAGILPGGGLRNIHKMDGLSGNAGSVVADVTVLPVFFCLLFFLICVKSHGTVVARGRGWTVRIRRRWILDFWGFWAYHSNQDG